jgi:hypothetical protein
MHSTCFENDAASIRRDLRHAEDLGQAETVNLHDHPPARKSDLPGGRRRPRLYSKSDYGLSFEKTLSETPARELEAVGHTMPDQPSREEINAKLEAAEARTEARFAQLGGTLDGRFAHLDTKIDQLVHTVTTLASGVSEIRNDVRSENRTTRWTIIGIAVGAAIAALAALWTTQANLLAAFQSGVAVKALPAEPPNQK